jgi:hypothetical protein
LVENRIKYPTRFLSKESAHNTNHPSKYSKPIEPVNSLEEKKGKKLNNWNCPVLKIS